MSPLERQIKINGISHNSIPERGPLLISANHPFGQIDALVLGYILEKLIPDFNFGPWDILNKIDDLKGSILPISFKNESTSTRINHKTHQETIKALKYGDSVSIFQNYVHIIICLLRVILNNKLYYPKFCF